MRMYTGVVYPFQCDAMGHMNVQHYMAAFDQAMWHLVRSLGYSVEARVTRNEGWADVRHDVNFLRELRSGDLFCIVSSVVECGTKSLATCHRMLDSYDNLAATDEIKSVYFDLAERKAILLPDHIRIAAREALAKRVFDRSLTSFA
ncbi:acyl-CoA thioesterase [Mesorhizobium ciceri]|uniref:acyl-CoA thioesterase n=1 Tax=Mesorhizobium TaxID=68287 RepID=UPI0009EF3DA9|nr:acyl-CoA thioesterase [Mesorhizobium ciceri]